MDHVEPTRVIIADDHQILRKGLQAVLGPQPSVVVVGEVASFAQLMDLLETVSADVVLLDLGGMGAPAVTAVSVLCRSYPQLAIIIFSVSLGWAQESLRVGAHGYVAKEDMDSDVMAAIHAVMNGRRFLSPTVTDYLERSGGVLKSTGVTPKEWQVLRLIAEGYGTPEIAEQMGVVEQTVSNYIYSLYRKTGCTERIQLAEWYRRHAPRTD